jgi:hypothetical protein
MNDERQIGSSALFAVVMFKTYTKEVLNAMNLVQ